MYTKNDMLPFGFSFKSTLQRLNIGLAVLKCVSRTSKQLNVCISIACIVPSTSQACCLEGKIGVSLSILPLILAASWLSRSLRSACCCSIILALLCFDPRKNTVNSFVQTLCLTGVASLCSGAGLRSSRILIFSFLLFILSVMICHGSAEAYL